MIDDLAHRKFLIWLDRPLSRSKFLQGVLRFSPKTRWLAVVNAWEEAGALDDTPERLLAGVPVVRSCEEALSYDIDTVLIGVCPLDANQHFPEAIRRLIEWAVDRGLTVVNPLHATPEEDVSLPPRVVERGRFVHLRKYAGRHLFSDRPVGKTRILCQGTDCAVGKMTAALLVTEALRRSGVRAGFLATGQTGIFVSGGGVPLDDLPGDFMAGAVEHELGLLEQNHDVIVIEGQGSILDPAYGGVSVALLHGSQPHGIILCDDLRRTRPKFLPERVKPSVWEVWEATLALSQGGVIPGLVGVSWIAGKAGVERGIPTCDPLVHGVDVLAQRIRQMLPASQECPCTISG